MFFPLLYCFDFFVWFTACRFFHFFARGEAALFLFAFVIGYGQ